MAQELTLKRTFEAPRELVFKAWTDPTLIKRWWGPDMFNAPVAEIDAKPGGKLLIVMHGPKGTDFDIDLPMTGTIREIEPPSRLVYTSEAVQDEQGIPQLETLTTVTFSEAGGKTEMTLHIVVTKATSIAAGALSGMEMGWSQSLEKLTSLSASLASDPKITKAKFPA